MLQSYAIANWTEGLLIIVWTIKQLSHKQLMIRVQCAILLGTPQIMKWLVPAYRKTWTIHLGLINGHVAIASHIVICWQCQWKCLIISVWHSPTINSLMLTTDQKLNWTSEIKSTAARAENNYTPWKVIRFFNLKNGMPFILHIFLNSGLVSLPLSVFLARALLPWR